MYMMNMLAVRSAPLSQDSCIDFSNFSGAISTLTIYSGSIALPRYSAAYSELENHVYIICRKIKIGNYI